MRQKMSCVISSFRRDADEICALVGFTQRRMVMSYRRFGTTYPSHLQGWRNPRILFLGFVDPCRWDWLSRNVGKELPLHAAQYLRRVHILKPLSSLLGHLRAVVINGREWRGKWRTVSLHVCCSTASVASPIGKPDRSFISLDRKRKGLE